MAGEIPQQARNDVPFRIALCDGHICLLTNLDTGTLVDILPDRKKGTSVAYFQRLGPAFCQQITAVSRDIWQPYLAVVLTYFPQATLVLDRFHVVKLLNPRPG